MLSPTELMTFLCSDKLQVGVPWRDTAAAAWPHGGALLCLLAPDCTGSTIVATRVPHLPDARKPNVAQLTSFARKALSIAACIPAFSSGL